MTTVRGLSFACVLLAGSAAAALSAGAAFAQTAPAAPPPAQASPGEIIVTAQHREERLRDVPITITALNSNQLDRAGVNSLLDLQSVAPGVRIDDAGNYVQPAIRGVSASVIGASTDAPVAIYLDGVYQPDQLANHFQFADIDRVEVDKGPQGTLYGRNATGGAVAVFTKSPSFTPTGDFEIGYGNYNDFLAKAFVSGPILGDVLAGSVAAYYERHDDYNYDIARHLRPPGLDAKNFRVKLLFRPTNNFQATLSLYYQDWKDSDAGDAIPLNGVTASAQDPNAIITTKPHDIAFNSPTYLQTRDMSATLNLQYDTPWGKLTSISDITYGWNHLVFDEDRAYSLVNGLAYDNVSIDHHSSEDLSFASRKFGRFSFIAGASYFWDDNAYDTQNVRGGPQAPGASLSPIVSTFIDHNPVLSYAAFGQGSFDITDRLTLTGGLRYTWEQRGNTALITLLPSTVFTGPPIQSTFDALTANASLRYRLTDQTNVYFSFNQGFKSGGQDAAAAALYHKPYRPEKINAYEVGIKSQVTPRISFNASAFYYDYTDLQVQVDVGGAVGNQLIENAGSARIYGVDLDATARLTDELTVTAGFEYLNARFVSYPNADVLEPAICTQMLFNSGGCTRVGYSIGNVLSESNASGNVMPRAPDITFTLTPDFKKTFAFGTLDVNATVYYSGKVYFDAIQRISQAPYATLAAQASFQPAGTNVKFEVWGKNLTNTTYIASVYEDTPADGVGYAPGTTFGFDIKYSF